jgi:DNA-binding cell septation regulator SpoVG
MPHRERTDEASWQFHWLTMKGVIMEPPHGSIAHPPHHVKNPVPPEPQGIHAKISIVNIHHAAGGNLRAFVDIRLGQSVVIRGFRIVQQPGQKAWVAPPQREYTGADGKPRYAPIVELSGALKRAVEQVIVQAWKGGASHG